MATIKDVARASGVSTATVSYVINEGPRPVGANTRQRVLTAMRDLNYHPSAIARGLARKPVKTIGVVTLFAVRSLLDDPYFRPIISGIIDAATPLHQSISLFNGDVWMPGPDRFPLFCDGRCDGLLIFLPRTDNDVVPIVKRESVPFIIIGEGGDDPEVSSIDIDNVAAADRIVGHLIEKGHRRIAYFDGDRRLNSAHDRLRGYRRALEHSGIAFDDRLVLPGIYSWESGRKRAVDSFIGLSPRPTAIFAASDIVALGAIEGLAQSGISVPKDVSIVAIDGINEGQQQSPRLTTISQEFHNLGESAVAGLIQLMEGKEHRAIKFVQPFHLLEGETVAPGPEARA